VAVINNLLQCLLKFDQEVGRCENGTRVGAAMTSSSACSSLELSVWIRDYLERLLFSTFGKERVKWALVEFLPRQKSMQKLEPWAHHRRDQIFFATYAMLALSFALFLEALRCCLNSRIGRSNEAVKPTPPRAGMSNRTEYQQLQQAEAGGEEEREEGKACKDGQDEVATEAARQRVRGYNARDLIFVSWHHVYIFMCLFLAGYAFLNEYISREYGLDWELYFPWFTFTTGLHLLCFLYAASVACRTRKPMPCVITTVANSVNPFDAYFGTLRDAVAAAVIAQYSYENRDWRPVPLSALMVITMFLPNFKIYSQVHPFRDFQENFWPIVIAMDRIAAQIDRDQKGTAAEGEQPQSCWQKAKAFALQVFQTSFWGDVKKFVLQGLDKSTREHKQAVAWYGDFPQALAGACFLVGIVGIGDLTANLYIAFVTFVSGLKCICVYAFRPHILCSLASNGLEWSHLTESDVNRAVKCERASCICRSRACRQILRDGETAPPVRVAAMRALQALHDELAKDDPEAERIKDTILWEVALHGETSARRALKEIRKELREKGRGKVVQLLRRLRSDDPGEKKEAALSLARDHKQCASAYVRDLYRLLSTPVTEAPRQEAEGTPRETGYWERVTNCCSKRPDGPDATAADETCPGDSKSQRQAEAEAFWQTQEVREAAAKALGLLAEGKLSDEEETQSDTEKQELKKKLPDAVRKVARNVARLLRNGDSFVRSAALIATVRFRGKAAEDAVEELLKKDSKSERGCSKAGEIALVELLPHLIEAKWAKWQEIADLPDDVRFRVLSRLGGSVAEAVLNSVSKEKLAVGELKGVLECQKRSAEGLAASSTKGANLVLGKDDDCMRQAKELLSAIFHQKGDVFEVLRKNQLECEIKSTSAGADILPVFLTDLEPDDIMFIVEMWKYLREQPRQTLDAPLIIFCVDFDDKDSGRINQGVQESAGVFELKLLLAALMLGKIDYQILTPKPVVDKSVGAGSKDKLKHELADFWAAQRQQSLDNVCKRIKQFKGKAVDYYICAPAHGNLGDLVAGLGLESEKREDDKARSARPEGSQVRSVHFYSGSFNVQGMTVDDLSALYTLVGKTALTDVSKYPFFGGNESVYKNFTDFALPSFAPLLSTKYPLIAAVWSLFNDTFNRDLVRPEKVLKKFLDPNLQKVFDKAKESYKAGEIQKYAKTICENSELCKHIVPKKKPTLGAFACGSCDAPLCDQLLFLVPWARENQPRMPRSDEEAPSPGSELTWLREDKGTWMYNMKDGFTSVDAKGTVGLGALRPVMREPRDAEALYRMREALQDYTLDHLSDLYGLTRLRRHSGQ